MIGTLGIDPATLQVTAFEVQMTLVVVFLAFAVFWVAVIEPYLAERTGPERSATSRGRT